MVHLRSFEIQPSKFPDTTEYPFCIPAVQRTERIQFSSAVTLFVGENGAGKSTLLESLAAAIGCITVGVESVATDPLMKPAQSLARCLKLVWEARTSRGFFLRAEDFINFARHMTTMRSDLEGELADIDRRYSNQSEFARNLARLPYQRSLHEMQQAYGNGLTTQSHGERFFQLFQSRFVPNGLYLLDEPETPLSPLKQLSLISLIKEMVEQDCQFIIATHSPILLAFPGATILNFDAAPIQPVLFDELEHVRLMRDFLNAPERFLKHL